MTRTAKSSMLLFLGVLLFSVTAPSDFLSEQKKFERVRTALSEKEDELENKLKENNLSIHNLNILLVAYKEHDQLDVYAKTKENSTYKKFHSYEICSRSGQLGPKRVQGDNQVPEGFYHIDRFNPSSSFYLSLGLNYPNLSDQRKSTATKLGGDIFIHGACVSIGCLPMTDNFIKEIYLLAVFAKNNGQNKIPVYIFPFRMTDENMALYSIKYRSNKALLSFWENLKIGFDKFTKDSKELKVKFTANGDYSF